ncbi:MAG TPA: hypothetical protein VMV07_12840 [Streptosporangiaceae bacterium]|nr:hypothetical protein [Streptosporangiaceae bacterium]
MISYNDWDPSSRRPRRPGRRRRRPVRRYIAGITAALLVIGLLIAGRALLGRAPASSSSPPAVSGPAQSRPTSPAGLLSLGACIDPTLSIVTSFAPAIRRELGQAIGSLAPPGAPLPTGATPPPQPGVSLTVREVDTTSLSSNPGPYAGQVAVPGIPGLTHSRPPTWARDYGDRLRAWSQGYQAVTAARHAAAVAAGEAARTIETLPLDQNPGSDSAITACISALLVTVPQGGRHSYLLASDLEENVAPQLAGSFRGAPLVIVQTCDTGNESFCHGLLQRFLASMHRLDVGPVTVVRPEDASQALRQWTHTGEVTP